MNMRDRKFVRRLEQNSLIPSLDGDPDNFVKGDGFCEPLEPVAATWGAITGTLSAQTDLQNVLDTKLNTNGNGSSLTGLTKTQVGLANADNTSDSAKPVSTATQTALDGKQATLVSATNIKTINGSTVMGAGDLVVTGTAADIALTKMAPAASQVITAGCSAYVAMFFETVATCTLEIGAGACFEVG